MPKFKGIWGGFGEGFGRDLGGLGEGFGTILRDLGTLGVLGLFWGSFLGFCMYFQAFYATLHVLDQ